MILDHELRGTDGVALAARLRVANPDAKVLMVLLSSVAASVRATEEAGAAFAAVLIKPIRQSTLYDRIADILDSPARADAPAAPAPLARLRPLTILLVEDDPFSQRVAHLFLAELGYPADCATSGEAALIACGARDYDVILMDVDLPGMSGFEATRAIRGHDSHQPHIIAMTANALQGDRSACIAAGMNDYLSKPILRQHLAAALSVAADRGVE